MVIHEVCTNEGKFYTNATDGLLRERMKYYIRGKLAAGYKHNEIMYCWGRVQFVAAQSIAAQIHYEKEKP